jgi:hypothetical protein
MINVVMMDMGKRRKMGKDEDEEEEKDGGRWRKRAKNCGKIAVDGERKKIKTEGGLRREIRWSPGDSRPALRRRRMARLDHEKPFRL